MNYYSFLKSLTSPLKCFETSNSFKKIEDEKEKRKKARDVDRLALIPREVAKTVDIPHSTKEILSRLPVKSLLRFRCVCKAWCAVVKDPLFVDMHLNNYSRANNLSLILESYDLCMLNNNDGASYEVAKMDYRTKSDLSGLSILGSCNGLLCLGDTCSNMISGICLDSNLCLWNPSTKRYRPLPVTPIQRRAYGSLLISCCSLYGFGYHAITKDYKVVSIVCYDSEYSRQFSCDLEIKVYSFRYNSWRKATRPVWMEFYYPRSDHEKRGSLVNGILHWLVIPSTKGRKYSVIPSTKGRKYSVIGFDVREEIFSDVPLPRDIDDDNELNNLKVTALDGYLCLICGYKNHVEAWKMEDYCKKESWIKLFTITGQREFRGFVPLCIRENKILLLDDNVLYLYDPEGHSVEKPEIKDIPERIRYATSYTESLLPTD